MRSRCSSACSFPSPGSGQSPGISYNCRSAFARFSRWRAPAPAMQLDLTRYRQPQQHFSRTFQPEEVAQAGDAYRIVAPVQVEFEIHKDKDKFRLVGNAVTELELSCSRCL